MVTCRSLLMVPVTLCFLLVLPAQSKENLAGVILYGTARCKSNPSKIISNATLHVTVHGITLAAGKTTSTGKFLMAVRVTSKDQLSALVSKSAVITAPRQACGGVPAPAAAARKLAAQPGRNGYRILADDDLGDLIDDGEIFSLMLDVVSIVAMLNSVEAPDPWKSLNDEFERSIVNIEQEAEVLDVLNFIEDSGLAVYDLLNTIHAFLGIPPIERTTTTTNN